MHEQQSRAAWAAGSENIDGLPGRGEQVAPSSLHGLASEQTKTVEAKEVDRQALEIIKQFKAIFKKPAGVDLYFASRDELTADPRWKKFWDLCAAYNSKNQKIVSEPVVVTCNCRVGNEKHSVSLVLSDGLFTVKTENDDENSFSSALPYQDRIY